MKRLTIGVIGLGLGVHHVAAYAQAKEVDRLVICDVDPERLAQTQSAFPQVHAAYQDIEDMLRTEHLDGVSIVTPDHLHRAHAVRCFQAGSHVLLTKPLATNLADAHVIVHEAKAAQRKLMAAHERRFRSHILRIKALLSEDALGEIVHLRIDMIQDKRGQFQRSPWYASAQAGRSALVGTGIHAVDLLRYLIDRPICAVYAFGNRLGPLTFPADKTTAALYQFLGGAIGQVTVSYESHKLPGGPSDADFYLVGTKGTVMGSRVSLDNHSTWQDLPHDGRGIVTGTARCVTSFIQAIVHDTPVAISGEDAFASLAACAAADESALKGVPITPEPFD